MLLVARTEDRLVEAADECAAAGEDAGGSAESLALDITERGAAERIVAEANERLRPARRARQQRRHRQVARPRRRPRRGLVRGLGAERDGADAPDARRRPRDARARLGPRRQRLQHRRQAPLGGDGRVLGREGGRALALPPLRRPLRRRRRPRQRRSAPARSSRELWMEPGGLLDQSKELAVTTAARRRSTRPARSARSAASPRSRRSPPRSSSSAPSAPPTWPAPPGASTAARCR